MLPNWDNIKERIRQSQPLNKELISVPTLVGNQVLYIFWYSNIIKDVFQLKVDQPDKLRKCDNDDDSFVSSTKHLSKDGNGNPTDMGHKFIYIYNALAPRFSTALKIKFKYFILPYMNSITNGVLQKQDSVTI